MFLLIPLVLRTIKYDTVSDGPEDEKRSELELHTGVKVNRVQP